MQNLLSVVSIFLRYGWYSKLQVSQSSPFFILGFGRSGNTVLRASLCSSYDVIIPPESMDFLYKAFIDYSKHNFTRSWPLHVLSTINLLKSNHD